MVNAATSPSRWWPDLQHCWSSEPRMRAVTVIIRARLRSDLAAARQLHDRVTAATKEMALGAGGRPIA